MRKLAIAALVGIAVALAAVGSGWYAMQRYLEQPMLLDGDVEFSIVPGSTLQDVLAQLKTAGISDDVHWLRLQARRQGVARQIKAGDYTLVLGTTPQQLLDLIVAGRVDLEQLTLIEGWTAAQAIEAVLEHDAIRNDLQTGIARRADGQPWLTDEMHKVLAAQLQIGTGHVEGWLYPDTYKFAKGETASTILRKAHIALQRELDQAFSLRPEDHPIGSEIELLTLASIIEKETSRADERGRIAGVFARRLSQGMRLQTDPTIIYGIGIDYDGDIRRRDIQALTDYNTYRIDGLPPTPIALPGRAALRAAAQPDDGEELFFVATGEPDGSHYFSKTNAEHEAAVQRYLKRLRGSP